MVPFVQAPRRRKEKGDRAGKCCVKKLALGYLTEWRRCALKLLLAGRGGEGKRWMSASFCAARRWRGSVLQQLGEKSMVARLAIMICDRSGGLSRRHLH